MGAFGIATGAMSLFGFGFGTLFSGLAARVLIRGSITGRFGAVYHRNSLFYWIYVIAFVAIAVSQFAMGAYSLTREAPPVGVPSR
jgi:hypothetical protein